MLDEFLFTLTHYVFGNGSERPILLLLSACLLFPLFLYSAFKIVRVLHAFVFVLFLAGVSFLPIFMFPELLDQCAIELGLISHDFVTQSPSIIRTPFVWGTVVIALGVFYLITSIVYDFMKGRSMTWKGRTEQKFQRAMELEEREIKYLKESRVSV